ncbi:hypothetical protein BRC81_05655 [Halobacteriales archaeon QS_1_68_20]|nr:MAG: hypothetical protein BRC81_05655 [Halobacteriales archaeon QS_1_68_20]
MPHQCTSCDRVFPDGSRDLLSGCPDCENNTFRYLPDDVVGQDGLLQGDQEAAPDDADEGSPVPDAVDHVTTTLKDFVSENAQDPEEVHLEDLDLEDVDTDAVVLQDESSEDSAQSSARSAIVSREELPEEAARLVRSDPGGGGAIVGGEILVGGTGDAARTEDAGPEEVETVSAETGDVETASGTNASGAGTTTVEAAAGESWEQPDLEELRETLNEQFEGIRVVEPGRYELNIMKLYERQETIIALKEDGRYVIDAPGSWVGDDPQ